MIITYKYFLPDESNAKNEYSLEENSLIIIGANGSGKSQLGAWMEKQDIQNTHRIGAQRSLVFGKYIQQRSYEQATNLLLYGIETQSTIHDNRWKWDGEKHNFTSSMLADYEYVLSSLIALNTMEQDKYVKECKELDREGKLHNKVPEMVIDKLKRIWQNIFPHRKIDIIDGKVIAIFEENGEIIKYKGRDMSDGERVVLYLIAQALCVPRNKTIIIDEPELHLHRSIMNRLWNAIEKERKDCLFIYITHDTQFAANHRQAKKIWVKSYNGKQWDWREVKDSALPEKLLLDILGNRKQVLFVEGTANSYDTQLYSEIFKDYYVVPCGSCSSVIAWTKAMKNTEQLHDLNCYGIIDRDYRTEREIQSYKKNDIYTLKVAEVENLFLVHEVLDVVSDIQGFKGTEKNQKIDQVESFIKKRFKEEINRQVCESTVAELKYMLTTATISKKNGIEAKKTLDDLFETIDYDILSKQHENKFNEIYNSDDYSKILSVFNRKSLVDSIGCFCGLQNKGYCDFIIRQLSTDNAKDIIEAMNLYLPEEIPR